MPVAVNTQSACVALFDVSNLIVEGRKQQAERYGAAAARDFRLHAANLVSLASAGRAISRGVAVVSEGATPLNPVWRRFAAAGLEVKVTERGIQSGREQGCDPLLQATLLRAICDAARAPKNSGGPGTLVLATGDGAGAMRGEGFFADLQRAHDLGWQVEVLAWRDSAHCAMRTWVERVGNFVALDDYFDSITFAEGSRFAKPLGRVRRWAH